MEAIMSKPVLDLHFKDEKVGSVGWVLLQPFCWLMRNHLRQPLHLLLQCAEKKQHPRLPVWGIHSNCHLGLAEREVIFFFALFDHTFQ
jgi:hypothetical protein